MKAGILNFLRPEDSEILLMDYPDYKDIDKEQKYGTLQNMVSNT